MEGIDPASLAPMMIDYDDGAVTKVKRVITDGCLPCVLDLARKIADAQ